MARHRAQRRVFPRPLIGLLHGTYAHLGVAGFWRRQRLFETDDADRQYAETEFTPWRSTTLGAARTVLASGKLTGIGQDFLKWTVQVLDKWNAEPIAQEILVAAQAAADRHRQVYLSTPNP